MPKGSSQPRRRRGEGRPIVFVRDKRWGKVTLPMLGLLRKWSRK